MTDSNIEEPQSAAEFQNKGWHNYGTGDLRAAEDYFRKAISLSPALIDAYYGLGLVQKAAGDRQGAVDTFQKVLDLLEHDTSIENTRQAMLHRLANAQVNMLNSGDWGLEKEIWKSGK